MNFKLLSLTAFLALASSVVARDDRIVVNHYDTATWCEDINWAEQCSRSVPPGGSLLSSYCKNGDLGGANPTTSASVVCSFGNLDIPGQLSIITGFVVSLAGATLPDGRPPVDACT